MTENESLRDTLQDCQHANEYGYKLLDYKQPIWQLFLLSNEFGIFVIVAASGFMSQKILD